MAQQEAVGHRSARIRARTHPLSAQGQPGNNLGEFNFRSKFHHFHGFRWIQDGPGEAVLRVHGVAYCAFLCFSSSPLDIFARNHFLIVFMKYPEPQGRAGAAGGRLEPDSQRVFIFWQIRC